MTDRDQYPDILPTPCAQCGTRRRMHLAPHLCLCCGMNVMDPVLPGNRGEPAGAEQYKVLDPRDYMYRQDDLCATSNLSKERGNEWVGRAWRTR